MPRYLVIAMRKPEFQPAAIEPHHAFVNRLREQDKLELSGAFTDKSGGAYVLKAANLEQAKALAFSDPLHTTNSSSLTIYEWNAK
ncbi:MAG TPA: YciI family protein [Burkholderiales bacterium]|nr:YciI family protein [Burkholderiales bacterium]